MKGLILGNSHVAALRAAFSRNQRLDLDFFAIPGGVGPRIRIDQGRLFSDQKLATVHSNIGNVEVDGLDLSCYDYVLVSSLGVAAVRADFSHPYRQFVLAGLGVPIDPDAIPLSADIVEIATTATIREQAGIEAVRKLADAFAGQIVCATRPLPAVAKLEADNPLAKIYGNKILSFLRWHAATQPKVIRTILNEISSDIMMLDTPNPTWVNAGSTPVEYCLTNDAWHMNADYGDVVLDQLCDVLKKFASSKLLKQDAWGDVLPDATARLDQK